jgi:hypothetical protein
MDHSLHGHGLCGIRDLRISWAQKMGRESFVPFPRTPIGAQRQFQAQPFRPRLIHPHFQMAAPPDTRA